MEGSKAIRVIGDTSVEVGAKRAWLRDTVSVSIFPVVLTSAIVLAAWGLRAGVNATEILGATSIFTMLLMGLAERVMPFKSDWNRPRRDVDTDLVHAVIGNYLVLEPWKAAVRAATLQLAILIPVAVQVWPSDLPIWLQLPLVALIVEFGRYWVHRLGHTTAFLWRPHAVHHSAERLYWLNAGRMHVVDELLRNLVSVPPVVLLGCPPDTLALYFVLQTVCALFQHANVDLRYGWLNWIFSGPDLHRWHHSKRAGEGNCNYGIVLILWDIVFGTRRLPHRDGPSELGLHAMNDFPEDYMTQQLIPFQGARWRTWREDPER